MRVVWGDGEVTLFEDGEDDSAELTADAIDELADLFADSSTLEIVLLELAAHVDELMVAGNPQAAAHAAAVLAALASRTSRTVH